MTFKKLLPDCFFEDYIEGDIHQFGTIDITQKEIIEFAQKYDPQVFHTDPEGAKCTHFGGIVASGWHTIGLATQLLRKHYLNNASGLGSPGVDEIRWLKPVRPGDRLSARVTVLRTKPSRTKPDRGAVTSLVEILNQNGELAVSLKIISLIARRVPAVPVSAR